LAAWREMPLPSVLRDRPLNQPAEQPEAFVITRTDVLKGFSRQGTPSTQRIHLRALGGLVRDASSLSSPRRLLSQPAEQPEAFVITRTDVLWEHQPRLRIPRLFLGNCSITFLDRPKLSSNNAGGLAPSQAASEISW